MRIHSYNPWRLVDQRSFVDFGNANGHEQVICDIDKTYIETEFESLVGLAKTAFEGAHAKVTVAGASELLLALRWGNMDSAGVEGPANVYPRPLHFVTSSPREMRKVLETKLLLDGLDWNTDTFKNQAYNIRKGRFDLLKQQIAYKSAAMLLLAAEQPSPVSFTLIGDNAELDPYLYLGFKLFLERRISAARYKMYLLNAGVEASVVEDIFAKKLQLPAGTVKNIFIRKLPNYPTPQGAPFTDPIVFFDDYFDVALALMHREYFDPACLFSLTRKLHNWHKVPLDILYGKMKSYLPHMKASQRNALLENLNKIQGVIGERAEQAPLTTPWLTRDENWEKLAEDEFVELGQVWLRR